MEAKLNIFVFISLVVTAVLHGSSAQTTHVVGDALGWTVPPGGEIAYRTWAATQAFTVGDVLVFNFSANVHNVAEVSKEAFDSCNTTNPISLSSTSPTNITLTSAGEHHFLCTFASHCTLGQKLAINVSAAGPTPTPEAAPSPAPVGRMTYTVGDSLGWVVPPGGPIAYQTWARGKSFLVGDTLVFNFSNGNHNVLKVTKAEYDSCNVDTTTTVPTTVSPARLALTSAGEHYYMCTFAQHCSFGQKLAINVTGSGAATPAPSPLSPAPTPSSPTTPPPRAAPAPAPLSPAPTPSSPTTPPPRSSAPSPSTTPSTPSIPSPDTALPPPPPSSSASSVAVAAWPFTLLAAVALALLRN